MQHQCFQLASVLDFQEWKRFLAYFRLNHTRFSPDLEPLMEVIKPQHPRFEMADEAMWRMAFPGRAFDNPRMRILRSYIKDLLEEFIIKIDLEADSTRRQLVLAEALLRREGLAPAQRIIATLRSSLPASPDSTPLARSRRSATSR